MAPTDGPSEAGPGTSGLSEAELAAAIVAASEDLFIVLDEDGVIRFASESLRRFPGVPEDLVGRSAFDLLDPGWIAEAALDLEAAFAGELGSGRVAASELRLFDGTSVLAELHVHRPKDPRVGSLLVQVHAVPGFAPLDDFLEAMVDVRGLDELLEPVLRLATADAPAEGCSVHWGWDGSTFAEHAATGVPGALLEPERFAPTQTPWRSAADTGVPVVLSSLGALDTDFAVAARDLGFGTVWSFPAPTRGDLPVVLSVWRRREGSPTSSNRLSIERALQMTALAVERQRAEEQLRHAAHHDPLTGAPNRTMLDGYLASMSGSGRNDAVLVLDLDGFKEVNDRHGHAAGDEVLRTVVDRLQRVLRPDDRLARLGGDEFAVVCAEVADHDEAGAIATRLIDALGSPIDLDAGTVQIGGSVGIGLAAPGVTGDQLLRAADEALIAAKRAGKGTYVVAPPTGGR